MASSWIFMIFWLASKTSGFAILVEFRFLFDFGQEPDGFSECFEADNEDGVVIKEGIGRFSDQLSTETMT